MTEVPAPAAPGAALGLRILVVDDDLNSREGLAMILESEGHVVAACANGNKALTKLRAGAYDVLLTDFVMPEMTGVELVSAALGVTPSLRCVIMSGHASVEAPAGVEWITKPIDLDALLASLRG